jgi:hypothetical protein
MWDILENKYDLHECVYYEYFLPYVIQIGSPVRQTVSAVIAEIDTCIVGSAFGVMEYLQAILTNDLWIHAYLKKKIELRTCLQQGTVVWKGSLIHYKTLYPDTSTLCVLLLSLGI